MTALERNPVTVLGIVTEPWPLRLEDASQRPLTKLQTTLLSWSAVGALCEEADRLALDLAGASDIRLSETCEQDLGNAQLVLLRRQLDDPLVQLLGATLDERYSVELGRVTASAVEDLLTELVLLANKLRKKGPVLTETADYLDYTVWPLLRYSMDHEAWILGPRLVAELDARVTSIVIQLVLAEGRGSRLAKRAMSIGITLLGLAPGWSVPMALVAIGLELGQVKVEDLPSWADSTALPSRRDDM